MVDRPLTFCTVGTLNYLFYMEALFRSLQNTNENFEFYALVIDANKEDEKYFRNLDFEVIYLDDMRSECIEDMKKYYDALELCCALKPSVIQYVMKEKKAEKVIYLDTDVFCVGGFDKIAEILDQHTFSFTPHVLHPLPLNQNGTNDLQMLKAGIFNAGFMAFRKSEKCFEILNWMIERFKIYGFCAVENNMFCDQAFFSTVATLYKDEFYCLDDEGYNIAYWNLHERNISYRQKCFYANENKAVFFHMSAFDPNQPNEISRHESRITVEGMPTLKILIENYIANLKACNKETRLISYRHQIYNDSFILERLNRRYYFVYKKFLNPRLKLVQFSLSVLETKQVVIYGRDLYGELLMKMLAQDSVEVICFCDRNITGGFFQGIPVVSPQMLEKYKCYPILIASTKHFFAIASYLEDCGFKYYYNISDYMNFESFARVREYISYSDFMHLKILEAKGRAGEIIY